MCKFFKVFLFVFLLFSFDTEEITQTAEVFFHDKSDALCVQTVAGEVAVVGLVVHPHSEVSVGVDEVAQVEIADEALGGVGLVAVAELSVEEQSVAEHLAAEYSFVFGIVESLVTSGYVGPEVPVVVVYQS